MNKRVPDDSCESAFKFLVRNGCVKGRKIKGLNACDSFYNIENYHWLIIKDSSPTRARYGHPVLCSEPSLLHPRSAGQAGAALVSDVGSCLLSASHQCLLKYA